MLRMRTPERVDIVFSSSSSTATRGVVNVSHSVAVNSLFHGVFK